mgnify:CR=1 FL=1
MFLCRFRRRESGGLRMKAVVGSVCSVETVYDLALGHEFVDFHFEVVFLGKGNATQFF